MLADFHWKKLAYENEVSQLGLETYHIFCFMGFYDDCDFNQKPIKISEMFRETMSYAVFSKIEFLMYGLSPDR